MCYCYLLTAERASFKSTQVSPTFQIRLILSDGQNWTSTQSLSFVKILSVAEMAAQLLLQWVPEPDIWASPHSSHFGLVCIFWPYCSPSQVWVPYSPPGFCCLTDKRQSLHHISHQLIKCVLACQSNSTFVFGGDTVFSTWLDWYPLIFVTSLEPELQT